MLAIVSVSNYTLVKSFKAAERRAQMQIGLYSFELSRVEESIWTLGIFSDQYRFAVSYPDTLFWLFFKNVFRLENGTWWAQSHQSSRKYRKGNSFAQKLVSAILKIHWSPLRLFVSSIYLSHVYIYNHRIVCVCMRRFSLSIFIKFYKKTKISGDSLMENRRNGQWEAKIYGIWVLWIVRNENQIKFYAHAHAHHSVFTLCKHIFGHFHSTT